MNLLCKFFGHKWGDETRCQRCGYDPFDALEQFIEETPEGPAKHEMRALYRDLYGDIVEVEHDEDS